MKSPNQIPSIADLPDRAGELWFREDHTAFGEPHISPALSGFFVRIAQKGRLIVDSPKNTSKTVPKEGEITKGGNFGVVANAARESIVYDFHKERDIRSIAQVLRKFAAPCYVEILCKVVRHRFGVLCPEGGGVS